VIGMYLAPLRRPWCWIIGHRWPSIDWRPRMGATSVHFRICARCLRVQRRR